ncbi:hypothetical protein OG413_40070 [Streptomyces sp. NBC_01433]|jgi:hypothetical protein|uniref:hypothetical protein n=1 Tax=Streptomyces sp. NBC_01433 TaxID=2903864 RepID=UPI00224D4801|nr:hypothetical protein [Streptomyces sp. NBC_01433]MCX4681396.1 hypothetical protein [Streptomyces sp. NBC_01433]
MQTFSLIKTAPADRLRTGGILRTALDRHGITHRVCGGGVERGHLATTLEQAPRVYITAYNDGCTGYDLPEAGHGGFTAVVTTDTGTSMVWDGPDAELPPALDAESCARSVATYLGLTPFFCPSCEDHGQVELFHPSTDALVGRRPCEDVLCVKRGERRAAAAALAALYVEHGAHKCTGYMCCPPF